MKYPHSSVAVISLFLITSFVISSCVRKEKTKEIDIDKETQSIGTISEKLRQVIHEKKAIFYGVYTPVEMSKLFEQYHIGFDPAVINPIENRERYTSNAKLALNIGVYGVDLSYIRMFNKPQECIRYYMTISNLSNQLGLPEDYIRSPMMDYERNLDNPEKLIEIATSTYVATEEYIKQNNRQHIASLLLVGGWVEALYIATHGIFDEENPEDEIIERIAVQKYSLNKLIALMETYAYDETVSFYLHRLNVLRKYFDQFGMYFENGTVEIDTINDMIYTERSFIDIPANLISEIKRVIAGIRMEIVL